jgi:hypothetical protein
MTIWAGWVYIPFLIVLAVGFMPKRVNQNRFIRTGLEVVSVIAALTAVTLLIIGLWT